MPRFPRPKLRDEFRRELRARLMTEAVTVVAPRARRTAWTFLRPAFTVGLASFVLIGAAGVAAAGSLPGDPAFGLKRAVEDLQVTFTFDDVQRVQLLAQLADRRVQELQKVIEQQGEERAPAAAEEVAQAVARFRAAVDAVQQAAPADKSEQVQNLVDAAREKHEPVLDQVQQTVDNEQAREAIERAREEENRDTHDEKDKQGKDPSATPRPLRTPTPARTPRPGDTNRPQVTPRQTERRVAPADPGPGRPAPPRSSGSGQGD